MPDYGERPAEENERRLETASCRDPPSSNYGAQMLERSLPPQQQQQQQQSGGRRTTGGIMRLANYRGWTVNIRAPKWKDNQFWINSVDLEAAQYIADAAFHFTGRSPVHFPDVKFDYLPLLLNTGEYLTTKEKCSAYVAKIAKGPALLDRRKDFKERAQKLILEMVKSPEVVRFLRTARASPRQAWQPRPEANPEDTDSPFTEDENGMPMEVDSFSEEAIQALAARGTVDAAAVFQFDSTMTTSTVEVDMLTSFIPSFEMDLYESENFLTSVGQSLGVWHRFGEKEKEDVVPHNYKEFLAKLDKDEEKAWKSIEPLDLEPWSPHPPFVPHSWLSAATFPGSGWQSRGTTSGADAVEALRPSVRPILCQNRWRP